MKKAYSLLLVLALIVSLVPAVQASRAPYDITIAEIAWMGTTFSYLDEWIELHNNTPIDIDLTGWRLVTEDASPDIALAGIIPAGGHYLLERTDDTSVISRTADLVYSGSLRNSPGEVITITNHLVQVVDVVGAARPALAAGLEPMNNREATPQQRAARLTWLFARGASMTTSQAAAHLGITCHGARRLLLNLSAAGIPIYPDDHGSWRTLDLDRDEP